MRLKLNKILLLALLLLHCFAQAEEIVVWHSFDGTSGTVFTKLVRQFNEQENIKKSGFKVVLKYKGDYDDALLAGLSVIGTKETPHILQLYEKGNLIMQGYPNAYVPLNNLGKKPSPSLKESHFAPVIAALFHDRGKGFGLASLPFSATSIVLFYNKNAFRAAGLDPEKPPDTWEDFEKTAQVLKKVGAKNILVSRWLSVHHIEQMGSWHNKPIATYGNGIDANRARLVINSPFFTQHFNALADWYEQGIFSLEVGDKSERAFSRGDALMITDGANQLSYLQHLVDGKFEIGVGRLLYWKKVVESPYNTSASGTSFWALAGHPEKDYEIVQAFFEYLVSPKVQNNWHQKTGYMPVILGVEALSEKQGFYAKGLVGKTFKIALDSFTKNPPQTFSRGILLPEFPTIRDVIIQEMKEAIQGRKTVEAALLDSVTLGNQIIENAEGGQH